MFRKIISQHDKGEHAGSPLQSVYVGADYRESPFEILEAPIKIEPKTGLNWRSIGSVWRRHGLG